MSDKNVEDIELLDTAEAAKYLRLSKSTIAKMVSTGELKSLKITDRRLFRKSDLNQFINDQAE